MSDEKLYELLIGEYVPAGIQRIEPEDPSKSYVEFKLDASQTAEGSFGEKFLRYVYQKFANSYTNGRIRDQHTDRNLDDSTAAVLVSKEAIESLKKMAEASSDLKRLRIS